MTVSPKRTGLVNFSSLAQVDGAGAEAVHGRDGGNEAGAEDAVGNPSAEPGGTATDSLTWAGFRSP